MTGRPARYCRAAYCTHGAFHAGRHSGLHYKLLDGLGVPVPAHAGECECHERPAQRAILVR